jgi:hypothetical protein
MEVLADMLLLGGVPLQAHLNASHGLNYVI